MIIDDNNGSSLDITYLFTTCEVVVDKNDVFPFPSGVSPPIALEHTLPPVMVSPITRMKPHPNPRLMSALSVTNYIELKAIVCLVSFVFDCRLCVSMAYVRLSLWVNETLHWQWLHQF